MKRKLKLIKHNKSCQKILNTNINNYIHFKNKYIIYDSYRKGKEYYDDNDNLIYEGVYLNSEKKGKGKEYFND